MFKPKTNRLLTANLYTLEELFDAIKEDWFTAGMPRLTHRGLNQYIVFPAIDSDNQVRVYSRDCFRRSNEFFVQRGVQVGAVVNVADLNGWWNEWSDASKYAHNVGLCERLAETTCKELANLGL